MNILSQDGKTLINYDNVASLYIQNIYRQYSQPDILWEIRAMYPAVSEDIVYDTIAQFDSEEKCKSVFKEIIYQISPLGFNLIKVSDIEG